MVKGPGDKITGREGIDGKVIRVDFGYNKSNVIAGDFDTPKNTEEITDN